MGAPKIIIGLLGIDQHEVGAIAVSSLLRDAGMEIVYVGRYNTPQSLVRIAMEEDADVIGISCHSWEYLDYVPELIELAKSQSLDVAVVLGGSVITAADARDMESSGVAAIFGPGDPAGAMTDAIRRITEARRRRIHGTSMDFSSSQIERKP